MMDIPMVEVVIYDPKCDCSEGIPEELFKGGNAWLPNFIHRITMLVEGSIGITNIASRANLSNIGTLIHITTKELWYISTPQGWAQAIPMDTYHVDADCFLPKPECDVHWLIDIAEKTGRVPLLAYQPYEKKVYPFDYTFNRVLKDMSIPGTLCYIRKRWYLTTEYGWIKVLVESETGYKEVTE